MASINIEARIIWGDYKAPISLFNRLFWSNSNFLEQSYVICIKFYCVHDDFDLCEIFLLLDVCENELFNET